MTRLIALLRNVRGTSAAEFALTVPLVILLIFGMLDVGRFMYEYNQAEKATQMGVRFAVTSEMVASGLETYSFVTDGSTIAGQPVSTASFSSATCDSVTASCSCTGGAICGAIAYDPTAFAKIVERVTYMYPRVRAENVTVEYRNVGIGYAGDPAGSDVAAMVTVRLRNMNFQPLSGMLFRTVIAMPDFRSSLTLEDGSGTKGN